MGTFTIKGPDGKTYRVTGDDPAGAMAALRKMRAADRQPQHPEFDGSHIPGYNPKTGMVEGSKFDSAMAGAADTVTSGFGDELVSGVVTGIDKLAGNGRTYEDNLRDIRNRHDRAQADNPKSYLAGQLAGGLTQGIALTPVIGATAPATLLGRVGVGAATGAGMGGLYGVGSGEGLEDRAIEGVKGATFGALVGGALPVVGHYAGKGYEALRNWMAAGPIAKAAGASPEALRMLGNVMEADGTRGQVGAANMARAGQDAMLADAGPNARAVLDASIQRGGPGAVQAQRAISDRVARGAHALTDALDNTLGVPEGITAGRSAIRTGTAAARSAAYDAAYGAPINYADPKGMALEQIIKGRVPGDIIKQANRLMQIDGDQSRQILARIADDGSVAFDRLPDVRQIDYITRALNQAAEAGEGAGALGGQTTLGRAYLGLSREIRDTLRDLVPEYGNALQTAADPIRRSQALELGGKLLSPSVTRDQADELVRGMTAPEKQAVAQGIRSRIDDVMANVTRTVQDGGTEAREAIKAIKDLSSRASRTKIEAIIGDKAADKLFAEIDRVARSFDLRAAVAENSKTFARLATDQRVKDVTAPNWFATGLQGKPISAMQRIAQALTDQTPERVAQRQDAIYSELARLLTRSEGASKPVFTAIEKMGDTDAVTALMRDRIARALVGPHLSYPSSVLGVEYTRGRQGKTP